MQILDSNISLSSNGSSLTSAHRSVALQLRAVSTPFSVANQNGSIIDSIAISSAAQKAYTSSQETALSAVSMVTSTEGNSDRLRIIKSEETQATESSGASSELKSVTIAPIGNTQLAQWNVEFSSTTVHYETQQMRVSAGGTITTQDGREINFTLDFGLSREYAAIATNTVGSEVVLEDPLVINFQGGLPGLSDTKFAFDINSDGKSELVYATAAGSGFLALDSNGDGRINNGSELFGPKTGKGFSELSGYDSDYNGWIDEKDGIFAKLSIWTKDKAGNDKLLTLKEAGVGALSLNYVASTFSLTDNENQMKGQIQNTGIYISEQGKAGVMQQIDLAVTEEQPEGRGESPGQQIVELSRTAAFETATTIRRLAATADWLAEKSNEIRRSFKEDLANIRKGHGRSIDPAHQPLNFIEKIAQFVKDSFKAQSISHKQ